MDDIERLLKELTEASGVSGYEKDVRLIMERRFVPLGRVSRDRLGSVIGFQKGSSVSPRILIAAHMDEIGFMVKMVTKEGFIKFVPLGGWPNQHLPAQRVKIQTSSGPVIGVIGTPPPHLLRDKDRNATPDKKEMFIDIGATSNEEVEAAGVRVGDPIIPITDFTVLSVKEPTYMAKAFDDRVGCALLISVMESLADGKHPNAVHGVGTVQEEVGLRGATTSAEMVNPDVAVILDIGPIGDVPGIKPDESVTRLGGGPNLLVYDTRMIPNLKLRDLVMDTAKTLDIPLQLDTLEFGGYDGGAIHLHKSGVPTVVIAIPTRHAHSHNSIIRRKDFDLTSKLVTALVRRLDEATVAGLCD
ncbi:M42 family metallopeptidase [Dehalogenimonas etheniformans]|uniref:M42 family peptidase n=1 Tax=Dehalogenimonas etheniformans TaxID=1536648 RepID=A0A2P5P564_9CHLR|nr:M42 family metallopeptidase [Dehalogenimonas etheniformans]PPD57431.1 M42 family peptidase [Dehalogenimonas etheniformans]QNT76798.1 M42 family metallopeptidase [Dehalogenimonas etheniformans]